MDITEIKEEATISEFFRILSQLNVVDAFPLSGFAKLSACDGRSLKKYVLDLTKKIICERLGSDIRTSIVENWFESRENVRWWNVRPQKKRTKGFQQKQNSLASVYWQLEAELRNERHLGESVKTTARQMLELLASVDHLLGSTFPYFAVLHDLPMLRSLAFDPDDDLEQRLFARGLVCRARLPRSKEEEDRLSELKGLPKQLEEQRCQGRIRMYAAAFCEFVANALKSSDSVIKLSSNTESVPRPSQESLRPSPDSDR